MSMFNYQCDEDYQTIKDVSQNYPQLTTYKKEWLFFDRYGYIPGLPVALEYQTIQTNDTATVLNAIPYQYKSAILKGQTVNNLWKELSNMIAVHEPQEGTTIQYDYSEQYAKITFGEKQVNATTTVGMNTTQQLQENKTYYINTFVLDGSETTDMFLIRDGFNNVNLQTTVIKEYPSGQILSFTTEAPTSRLLFYYFAYTRKYGGVNYGKPYYMPKRFIVSDKLEDVVNQDFFDGMQSVKMPVLKTTGKNLMSVNHARLDGISANTGSHVKNLVAKNIPVKSGKTYTVSYSLSCSTNIQPINITRYEHQEKTNSSNHQQLWNEIKKDDGKLTFTIPQGINYISFTFGNAIYTNNGIPGWIQFDNLQLEEGSIPTEYEPYKSNILTVNEEVELRGIGEVQDELNLLTGELTQHIGEVVLDSSNIQQTSPNYMNEKSTTVLVSSISNSLLHGAIIADGIPTYKISDGIWKADSNVHIGISQVSNSWGFAIRLPHSLTGITTENNSAEVIQKFKTYLQTNPITVQYQLATEFIKTVDLSSLLTKPYEGVNHYQVSSDTINPTFVAEVPIVSEGEQTLAEINQATYQNL